MKGGQSMPKRIQKTPEPIKKRPPARTPEARENQLIALAMDLVEKRLRNGTATSQETTHFLRLATVNSKLEREILERQKDLITAKTEALKSQKRTEELYANALEAMRSYAGHSRNEEDDYD